MTASELRSWASEHLMYEVDHSSYATVEFGKAPEGRIEDALLESFAVHARCLNDFLWHDGRKSKPEISVRVLADPARACSRRVRRLVHQRRRSPSKSVRLKTRPSGDLLLAATLLES